VQEIKGMRCKGFEIKGGKDNAIAIVLNDLFIATDVEGDGGHATGDGFYQGIGEVIRTGGIYKEVRCVIAVDHILFTPDIVLIMDLQVMERGGVVQPALSHREKIDLFRGESVYMAEDGLQVGAAFPDIGLAKKSGAEHDRLPMRVQAELPACGCLIPGSKYVRVETVIDEEDLFAFEDGALKGEFLQPAGGTYHRDVGVCVNRSFLAQQPGSRIDPYGRRDLCQGVVIPHILPRHIAKGMGRVACEAPHVMEGPDQGGVTGECSDQGSRKIGAMGIVKMDDIGLEVLYFFQYAVG